MLGREGQVKTGIAQLRQGLEDWQAMGAGVSLTYYHLLLAELSSLGEEYEEGLRIGREALRIPREGRETWIEAEHYRRQGELVLMGMADEKQTEA